MSVELVQILLCFQSVCFIISILLLIRAQGQALSVCRYTNDFLFELRRETATTNFNSALEEKEDGTDI